MIKLRAWYKGQMKYDIDLIHYDKMEGGLQGFSENGFEYEKENVTWMRFTGLHDKNGIEIFEGDLIRHNNGTVSEVKARMILDMGNRHLGIPFLNEKTVEDWFDQDYEVIGNIYENSDLLK